MLDRSSIPKGYFSFSLAVKLSINISCLQKIDIILKMPENSKTIYLTNILEQYNDKMNYLKHNKFKKIDLNLTEEEKNMTH